MKNKLQESYEVLGGAWVMAFPCFLLKGLHWGMLFLMACSVLLYWAAVYRKSILFYLAVIAGAVFVVTRMGADIPLTVTVSIGLAMGVIGYFVGRWKESPGLFGGVSFWYLVLTAVGYFVGIYQKSEVIKDRTCIYAILLILICLLNENQKAVLAYVKENEKLHRFPGKTLKKRNQTVIIVFCLLVLGAMIGGFRAAPEDPTLPQLQLGSMQVETGEMDMGMEMDMSAFEMGEYKEPPAWLVAIGDFIYKLFEVLLVILAVALAAAAVYGICHGYKSHYKKVEEAAADEEEDQIEKVMPRGGGLKKFFERKTPSELIRKYYKKWIRNALKTVPCTDAPAELESRASLSDTEFHVLYEKARYSQTPCTREESQRIKQKL